MKKTRIYTVYNSFLCGFNYISVTSAAKDKVFTLWPNFFVRVFEGY